MAFAAAKLANNLAGYFVEKDYGRPFEYKMNDQVVLHPDLKTGKNTVYPHLIFVGPEGDQTRWALVKKTVAYVVVDEDVDANGRAWFKIEKWNIKGHREYKR